jgi:phosphonate transport system substrate-binding protein
MIFALRQAPGLAVVLAILLFDGMVGAVALGQTAKTFALGMVSEVNQKEIEAHFQNFVRYVAGKLSSPEAKLQGRVVVAANQSRLAALLQENRADFYMESPHPTYIINTVYAAGKLLLRRWKGGAADYHASIFTASDSETKRLEDLKGKVIAFEDPESTSGYFLPKMFLTKKGFKLAPKAGADAKLSREEVGYIFAQTQDKLIDLVLGKKVAAGAFSNDDYATLDGGKKANIAILADTASLPRHLVSVRKNLAPGLTKSLEKVLLSMHQDPEGSSILQKADGTTKFDPLPGGELAMRQRLLDIFYSPAKK